METVELAKAEAETDGNADPMLLEPPVPCRQLVEGLPSLLSS